MCYSFRKCLLIDVCIYNDQFYIISDLFLKCVNHDLIYFWIIHWSAWSGSFTAAFCRYYQCYRTDRLVQPAADNINDLLCLFFVDLTEWQILEL